MKDPVVTATAVASTDYIVDVALDSQSLVTRSADIEIERHKAISDLLHQNSFKLVEGDLEGPYRLALSFQDERFVMDILSTRTRQKSQVSISMTKLKRHIADYVILCDNFYKTARAGQIHKLETIDAGRRSIHDEAAEMLIEALENKVILDKATARRLFSLIYVLHMRGIIHP